MRPNYRVDKTAKSSSNLINYNNELIHGIQGGPHLWSSCRRVKNFQSNLFKNRQTSQINHITSLVEVIMSNLTVLQIPLFVLDHLVTMKTHIPHFCPPAGLLDRAGARRHTGRDVP